MKKHSSTLCFLRLLMLSAAINFPVMSMEPNSMGTTINEPPSKKQIDPQFSTWVFIEHLEGAGGGVDIYEDVSAGKKYTVKTAKNRSHLIEEIVAKALYDVLGFNVPRYMIIDRIQSLRPQIFREKYPEESELLISEYVEDYAKEGKPKLMRWVDVLLGNFDLAGHNYVVDKFGEIFPIDYGASLRLRACGELKEHKEGWGYFWPKEYEYTPPREDEIEQFKTRIPAFFDKLKELHHTLSIPDFPSLWHILASRTHSFLAVFDPENLPVFGGDRPAIQNQMGAGVLLMSDIEGIPHVLLGDRKKGALSDLGGGADFSDKTLSRCGWREFMEKMGAFTPHGTVIAYDTITNSPFIEHYGDILYRMYVVRTPHFSAEDLKKHVDSPNNPYTVEHTAYRWIPVTELFTSEKLFEPFSKLLATPHARKIINAVAQNQPCEQHILDVDLISESQLMKKGYLNRQLRARFAAKHPVSAQQNFPYTASQATLKAHLQERYVEGDETLNLQTVLLEKSLTFKRKPDFLATQLAYIQEIIGEEERHPNEFVFYHGAQGHLGLLWIFGSILREELFLETHNGSRSLRLYDSAFNNLLTLADHFENFNQNNGPMQDYAIGGQARILSTNLSLLGSLGHHDSETIQLFFEGNNFSIPEKPAAIIETFLLNTLQLPKMAVTLFMKEIDQHFNTLETVGALWQCFLPEDTLHSYTYLSYYGGKYATYVGEENAEEEQPRSPLRYIKTLRENPEHIQEILPSTKDFNALQGRIFLHPDLLFGPESHAISTKIYFADNTIHASHLQHAIRQSFEQYLKPHLHLASGSQAYIDPPRFLKLHQLVTGSAQEIMDPRLMRLVELKTQEEKESSYTAEQRLQKKTWRKEVRRQLKDITIAKLEMVNPLTLERTKATDQCYRLRHVPQDALSEALTSGSQKIWQRFIRVVNTRHDGIVHYLKSINDKYIQEQESSMYTKNGKKATKTEDICFLLGVGFNDPNLEKIKTIHNYEIVQNILKTESNWNPIPYHIGRVIWGIDQMGEHWHDILTGFAALKIPNNILISLFCCQSSMNKGLFSFLQLKEAINLMVFLKEKYPIRVDRYSPFATIYFFEKIGEMGAEKTTELLTKIYEGFRFTTPQDVIVIDSLMNSLIKDEELWNKTVEFTVSIQDFINPSDLGKVFDEFGEHINNREFCQQIRGFLETLNIKGWFHEVILYDLSLLPNLPPVLEKLAQLPVEKLLGDWMNYSAFRSCLNPAVPYEEKSLRFSFTSETIKLYNELRGFTSNPLILS